MGFVVDEQATVKCLLDICNYNLVDQVAIYRLQLGSPKRSALCDPVTNTSNYTCKFDVDMSYHNLKLQCGVVTNRTTILYSSNFIKLLVQS